MNDLEKLAGCAVLALAIHAGAARALELLPPRPPQRPHAQKIEVRVVEPPPALPPEPEPPPLAPPPTPEPPKPPPPKPAPTRVQRVATPQPAEAPPPPTPAPPADSPVAGPAGDQPVFGVAMSSTSQAGNGPLVPVGAAGGRAGGGAAAPAPGPVAKTGAGAPVPDYAVTTPPLPQGRCTGKYTDAARTAGVEGTVVLDLVVGEDGSVRDITVTQPLGHGLDQAAVAALRACRFTPGEKDGQRVAVRVHGFKIHFMLADAP